MDSKYMCNSLEEHFLRLGFRLGELT